MAAPTSRTVPSSPNSSAQGSPHNRDWSNLRTGEPGSAFRGMGKGRGGRGGVKASRGGGHPPNNSGQKGSSHSDTANSSPSPSPKVVSASRKPSGTASITTTPSGTLDNVVNGSAQRGGQVKPGSNKPSRAVPAVVVAPASPSKVPQSISPSPSRSSARRRHIQLGKSITTTTKPLSSAPKTQKSRGGSTPVSQTIVRKDIPPHLAAAHEAEVRHDIDAFVERVRAVAMAENRPTTPGSHIDWAGDEDDSLPDLDDWGITTTHTNVTCDDRQTEEISPILADALKPLPEPNSDVRQEEEREMETYDAQPEQATGSPVQPSFLPSPFEGAYLVQSTADKAPAPAPGECIIVPTVAEKSSSLTVSDGKLPSHPSLPPKPVAAVESVRVRGQSISRPSSLPHKPLMTGAEEALTTNTEGLSESIHAPSPDDRIALEKDCSASSSERGLTASIHAPVPGLPESHSTPSLLSGQPESLPSVYPSHSRSHTEGRFGPHTAPPSTVSHRHGRPGATSPLGKHVYTHSRNHSTPAGGTSSRQPQASRPVITGEAISRLARTIGGLGPASRTQTIPVTKDSPISS